MKKCLIYCWLSFLSFQLLAQEVTISLSPVNLQEELHFDNWTYESEIFFVVPVQLSEFTPFVEFYFNLSYNPAVIEPLLEGFQQVNLDSFIEGINAEEIESSMVHEGVLTPEVFAVSGSQSMLTVSFMGDSATASRYNLCNGNLMYLPFKKIAPCQKAPIFLTFWDGNLGETFVNEVQTSEFSMQSDVYSSTSEGTAIAIGGEVIPSFMQGEAFQDGSFLAVNIVGGTPPYTYQWEDKKAVVLGVDSIFYPENFADYLLVVTDANGCLFYSYATYSEVNTITEKGNSIKNVFPNPVQNYFTIQGEGSYSYQILDARGKSVIQGEGNGVRIIFRENILTGLYVLVVENREGDMFYQKLIFN